MRLVGRIVVAGSSDVVVVLSFCFVFVLWVDGNCERSDGNKRDWGRQLLRKDLPGQHDAQ